MADYRYIGKNIPRVDAWDKVTGRGLFTHDVTLPRMLYAKVLRSPHAHARIVSIDTSQAEALPGVIAVGTYLNTTNKLFNPSNDQALTMPPHEPIMDMKVFTDEPRYIGDEVAGVAAVSEKIAEQALSLIKVEYELLPAVFDPLEALKDDAPVVQPTFVRKNVLGAPMVFNMGDMEKGWAEADVVSEQKVFIGRLKHAQLETQAALADYRDDGTLAVCSATQSPHAVLMILSHLFEIPESKIQVYNPPYVGGGFGTRCGCCGKAEIITTALSALAHRPVKMVYSRQEDFTASDSRHGGYITARLGAKKDGTFTALEVKAYLNIGAYATYSMDVIGVLGSCGSCATYYVPNFFYEGNGVYTNQMTAGAFRGFGTPQGTFAVETVVDDLAKRLGIDPVELRKKNSTKVGDPWFFPYPVGSTGLNECLDKAAAAIGWTEKRGKEKNGNMRHGVGIAAGCHVSNAWPFCVDYSSVNARIEGDGSLYIAVGVPEIGPGSTTGLTQIAAEVVGVDINQVTIKFGDTDAAPFDAGTHATRTLYTVGKVISIAGNDLKEQMLTYAAELLKVAKDKLSIEMGVIKGGGKEITLRELAYGAHRNNKRFLSTVSQFIPNSPPWIAHAAEVEVDMETGMVQVVKMACAHDVGRAVNPLLVVGQIQGGVAMGIGGTTREEMTYVDGAGFYNDGYHKYMLLTAGDMPEIIPIIVESTDPVGPFNAKGVGECAAIPTAAAIVSAVEDAIGIRYLELPLTPERVLAKIKEIY
jgi:xanthine dehydrogenase molybdenum-binding subunit